MSNLDINKPWLEVQASTEKVKEIWSRFEKTKDRAEQCDFARILMADLQYTPLYKSLMKHYDEYHAQMFIYGLTKIVDELGYC